MTPQRLALPRPWSVAFWVVAALYAVLVALAWWAWVDDAVWPDPQTVGASFAAVPLVLATFPWSLAALPIGGLGLPAPVGEIVAATVMAILCGGANLVLLRLVLVGVERGWGRWSARRRTTLPMSPRT